MNNEQKTQGIRSLGINNGLYWLEIDDDHEVVCIGQMFKWADTHVQVWNGNAPSRANLVGSVQVAKVEDPSHVFSVSPIVLGLRWRLRNDA